MTIMSVMFSALLAFVLFFNVVSALPLTLVARDSVDPPITNPVAGAVWHVGDLVTVTWDTSVFVGVNVTNATGTIVLGFLENDSENLMLNSPLAEGFSLFTGSQDVTVPDVPSKTDYVIALLGSSGNISPEFQIVPKLVATPSPPISELPLSSSPSAVPTSSLPTPTSSGASVSTPASTPLSTPVPTPSVTPTTTPSPTSTPTTPVSSATSTPTTPVLSPTSTSLVTASPSAGVPASDNSNTNDAFTSKHVKMSSVLLAAAVALFMI